MRGLLHFRTIYGHISEREVLGPVPLVVIGVTSDGLCPAWTYMRTQTHTPTYRPDHHSTDGWLSYRAELNPMEFESVRGLLPLHATRIVVPGRHVWTIVPWTAQHPSCSFGSLSFHLLRLCWDCYDVLTRFIRSAPAVPVCFVLSLPLLSPLSFSVSLRGSMPSSICCLLMVKAAVALDFATMLIPPLVLLKKAVVYRTAGILRPCKASVQSIRKVTEKRAISGILALFFY